MIFYSNVLGCYIKAIFKSDYHRNCLCIKHENSPFKGLECAYSGICLITNHGFHEEMLRVKHLWNDYRIIDKYECGRSMTLGFIRLKTNLILSSKYKNLRRLRKRENLKSV